MLQVKITAQFELVLNPHHTQQNPNIIGHFKIKKLLSVHENHFSEQHTRLLPRARTYWPMYRICHSQRRLTLWIGASKTFSDCSLAGHTSAKETLENTRSAKNIRVHLHKTQKPFQAQLLHRRGCQAALELTTKWPTRSLLLSPSGNTKTTTILS